MSAILECSCNITEQKKNLTRLELDMDSQNHHGQFQTDHATLSSVVLVLCHLPYTVSKNCDTYHLVHHNLTVSARDGGNGM